MCRTGDLRNDSFTWRGGTPHLLGTEFIANVGAGLLAPGGGGDAGLAAEGGVEVLRARESARAGYLGHLAVGALEHPPRHAYAVAREVVGG